MHVANVVNGDRPAEQLRGVLLVHGVGDPPLGAVRAAALDRLTERGLSSELVEEVNWNAVIQHPGGNVDEGPNEHLGEPASAHEVSVGTAYLARLSRAVMDAGQLPPFAVDWPVLRRHPGLCRFIDVTGIPLALAPAVAALCLILLITSRELAGTAVGSISWWLSVGLGVGLVVTVLLTLGAAAMTRNPAVVRGCVRRVLLCLGWPAVYPAFAFANLRFRWLVPPILFVCVMAAWQVADRVLAVPRSLYFEEYVGTHRVMYPTATFTAVSAIVVLLIFTVGSAVTYAAYMAVRRLWLPLIKVVADVALYLGRPDYREALVREVERGVERLIRRGCTHVIFVTHSLGTVITVDAIRRRALMPRTVRVTLFTSGSPLRRLFSCFFPAQYAPPAKLCARLKHLYPEFVWINVFRPRDPIGGHLGLPDGCDSCTDQPYGFLRAHVNYWADEIVYRRAVDAFDRVSRSHSSQGAATADVDGKICHSDPLEFAAKDLQPLRDAAVWVPVVWVFLFLVYLVASHWLLPVLTASTRFAALREHGRATGGRVLLREEERPLGGTHRTVFDQRMRAQFIADGSGGAQAVNARVDGILNDKASIRAVFAEGRARPGEDGFEYVDVVVRYLPSDPETCVVLGHERPQVGLVFYIGGLAGFLLHGTLYCAVAALVLEFAVFPVLMPAFGSPAPTKRLLPWPSWAVPGTEPLLAKPRRRLGGLLLWDRDSILIIAVLAVICAVVWLRYFSIFVL